MFLQLFFADEIEQRDHRSHGTVAEFVNAHGHDVFRYLAFTIQLKQALDDGMIHLRIG